MGGGCNGSDDDGRRGVEEGPLKYNSFGLLFSSRRPCRRSPLSRPRPNHKSVVAADPGIQPDGADTPLPCRATLGELDANLGCLSPQLCPRLHPSTSRRRPERDLGDAAATLAWRPPHSRATLRTLVQVPSRPSFHDCASQPRKPRLQPLTPARSCRRPSAVRRYADITPVPARERGARTRAGTRRHPIPSHPIPSALDEILTPKPSIVPTATASYRLLRTSTAPARSSTCLAALAMRP